MGVLGRHGCAHGSLYFWVSEQLRGGRVPELPSRAGGRRGLRACSPVIVLGPLPTWGLWVSQAGALE